MKENYLEHKKEISNIHFLIHPGYLMRQFVGGHDKRLDKLMASYVKKAQTLKTNEIMVIFSPSLGSEFTRDIRDNEIDDQV